MTLYILFESAIGYAVFKLKEFDDVNTTEKKVQKQIEDFETFSSIANLFVLHFLSIVFPPLRIFKCCHGYNQHNHLWQGP